MGIKFARKSRDISKPPRDFSEVSLSPKEVARMIETAPSLRHHTILIVLYAPGMHRTETSRSPTLIASAWRSIPGSMLG